MLIYYLLMVAVIIADQAVKAWTAANLAIGAGRPLIPGVVSLLHIRNTGAAWGILEGQMALFYIVTVVVVGALLWQLHHQKVVQPLYSVSLALIIAGALGNFIDRVRLGNVIDMFRFEFINFPIFNVADAAITVGIVLLLVSLLFTRESNA